ncbi:MAG TPA: hypothetical protein PKI19_02135 [Elusimicrobiales bacterium]|nr:hypothetical protein [Elusimicrobiales bacterium]
MRFFRIAAIFSMLAAAGQVAAAAETPHRYGLVGEDGRPEGAPVLDLAGVKIVFYGVPGAVSSAQALEEISKDAAAAAALFTRGFLLTGAANAGAAAQWNGGSRYEYAVLYSTADWPELAGAAAPQFLFYAGGAQVCAVQGRGGASVAQEFRACMGMAGLGTAAARLESAALVTALGGAAESDGEENKTTAAAEGAALLAAGVFMPETLAGYDAGTLKNAYKLAANINFYTPYAEMLAAQAAILAALEQRGLANENKVRDLHERLLDSKKFAEAEALRAHYPAYALQKVPPLTAGPAAGPGEAAVYYTRDGETGLALENVVKVGTRIIVAASPGCHFAENALDEIEKDAELSAVFGRHALLLTSKVDFGALGQWNQAHKMQYRVASDNRDWPGVDFSFSPGFYFLKDGKIVHTVGGWAREGFLEDISAGARLLFPDLKLSRVAPEKAEPKTEAAAPAARRRTARLKLGDLLKGLNDAQLYRFCASLRFSGGVYAGADLDEVREIFGESRVEKLNNYFTGGAPVKPGLAPGPTLGELWKDLDAGQLNQTCRTISFYKGSFGGLNFGEIEDVYGAKGADEAFAYFMPAEKDGQEDKK